MSNEKKVVEEKEFEGERELGEEELRDFGYWSKLLKKDFNTYEELIKAEDDYYEEEEKKKALVNTKKERAKEVEDAYLEFKKAQEEADKVLVEARKKAQEIIREAETKYYNLRDKFAEDYNGYHMTYSNMNGIEQISFGDLLDSFTQAVNDLKLFK